MALFILLSRILKPSRIQNFRFEFLTQKRESRERSEIFIFFQFLGGTTDCLRILLIRKGDIGVCF